jgi:rod shape-determining protein MreC
MFSKKMVLVLGVIILITVNIVVLSITTKRRSSILLGRIAMSFAAPFQELVMRSERWAHQLWEDYFYLVSTAHENRNLRKQLEQVIEENNRYREIEQANHRLRELLEFRRRIAAESVAAEVIGKDPSGWFRSLIIDKGSADGLSVGQPVITPQGIAGQTIEVSEHYAKVMLLIDRNSAVDSLVQRTRARGVVKGDSADRCRLEYVLRKHEVKVGDIIVSSGFDGVFPKGLRVGEVVEVNQDGFEIFLGVTIAPYVDFEKLEEVLVLVNSDRGPAAIIR